MSFFLSVVIFLTPLVDIPPTAIWLGKGISVVQGEKIKAGETAKSTNMMLSVHDFIRLKSAMENSTDLCSWAITETYNECMQGSKRQLDIALNRESNQSDLIAAYEHRLKDTETSLSKSENYSKILLYVVGGLAIVSASTTTLYLIGK